MIGTFQIDSIKALRVANEDIWPWPDVAEIYQTWTITKPIRLQDKSIDQNTVYLHTGCSVNGGATEGTYFSEGQTRRVNDPMIVFSIDDLITNRLKEDFQVEMHFWESDRSTKKVKSAFTDASMKMLYKGWVAASEDNEAAVDALMKKLSSGFDELDTMIRDAGSATENTFIKLGSKIIGILPDLVNVLATESDDYLWKETFVISVDCTGVTPRATIVHNGVRHQENPDRKRVEFPRVIRDDAPGTTQLDVQYLFSLV